MYAIVNIAGQQFKVEKGKKLFVHRLTGNVGDELNLGKVMLISNGDKVSVGTPYLNKALILAKINAHVRGDKVQVFKKKRRKGYQVLNGHRQDFTEILIEDIAEDGIVTRPIEKPARKAVKKEAEVDATVAEEVKAPEKTEKTKAAAPKKATKAATTKKAEKAVTAEAKAKPAAKKPSAKKGDSAK
jgi:large subunit ribosomal protein L21